ncbi:MAG TPA: VOC family protein [Thermoplasmata archaeon]|nr:VOC family protein [Thermoplasmata archaeon]
MASPRAINHVSLFVRDPGRMREFYERVLGFRLVAADAGSARFDAGGVQLVLRADPPFGVEEYRDFVNQLKGNMRGMGASVHFEVDDVDVYFSELAAKGIVALEPEKNRRLDAPVVHDGRREFAIEDPEGYWLYFGEGAR